MKKIICLILATLMAVTGVCCLAEGKDENEETAFLQIKEGVTAKVYRSAGDAEANDSLKSGSFCGLIEETAQGETPWFHVFYLNSKKKGATGYIQAADANRLTWKNLKEMMEDPAKVNEILDLIDALNDYLKTKDTPQNPVDDNTNTNNKGGEDTNKNRIQQFYEEAMDALKQVFSTDLSKELEKAAEAGKETAEKVADAGRDILEAVAEGAEDLFNKAKDAGKDALENALEEAKELFNKAKDTGKDAVENAAEDAMELLNKAGETLEKELEDKLPGAIEKLEELADSVSDAAESIKDGSIKKELDSLVENVSDRMQNLTDELSEKMKDLTDNPAQELYDNLVDKVMDTIDILKDDSGDKMQELKDNVGKIIDELDHSFGNGTGFALDQVNKLADDAREMMSSMEFTLAQSAVNGLADLFREEGFSQGVQATSNLIQLLSQINNK